MTWTEQNDEAFAGQVNEMLDTLIDLWSEKWARGGHTKDYIAYHLRRMCELYASKARIDVLTELKNEMDEQKKRQEKQGKT